MSRFGAKSPKRTRLWANSRGVSAFTDSRPMTAKEKKKVRKSVLVQVKINPKTGKKVFTGNKAELKASGRLASAMRKF